MNANIKEFIETFIEVEKAKNDPQFNLDSPEACDLCGTPFENQEYLIDGEVINSPQIPVGNGTTMGQWAYMCPGCFQSRGVGIKWGRGQLYKKTSDNEWLLVGGFPPDAS